METYLTVIFLGTALWGWVMLISDLLSQASGNKDVQKRENYPLYGSLF